MECIYDLFHFLWGFIEIPSDLLILKEMNGQ